MSNARISSLLRIITLVGVFILTSGAIHAATADNPEPTITGFTTSAGPVGTEVIVNGTNFTGATSVRFNTTNATSFSVVSETQIRATVPTGATTGPITVTTPNGSATSIGSFIVGLTISGRISYPLGGVRNARVTLSGSGSTISVLTGVNGEYSFTGLAPGTYTITPSLTGYTFTPTTRNVTLTDASISAVNFAARAQGQTISGRITTSSGAGVAGIRVTRSGSTTSVLTNAHGYYTFTNVPSGNHTISASQSGYTLSPASRNVTLGSTNLSDINFTATRFATVRGRVVTSTGAGVAGVRVLLAGPDSTLSVNTNANGEYSFSVPAGNYTAIPLLGGYSFATSSRAVTVGSTNISVTSFVASRSSSASYLISGRVTLSSGAGVSGVRVVRDGGRGAFTFTNANGEYYFPGLAPGTYTVTCLLTNFNFNPARLTVRILTTSVTNANFIAIRSAPVTGRSEVARSSITLSTGSVNAATNSLQLQFSGALDVESASDAANYSVQVNGQHVQVESASYSANIVTLALPEGALQSGDAVTISWSGLDDANGATLAGQVGPLAAR